MDSYRRRQLNQESDVPPGLPEGVTTREQHQRDRFLGEGILRRRWAAADAFPADDGKNGHAGHEAPEPGIDVWADLRLKVEGATREVQLHYRKYAKLWASLHDIPLTGPALSSTQTPPVLLVDRPDILGPHTGFYWDVRWLTFAPQFIFTTDGLQVTNWAGTIYVFNSLVSGSNFMDSFSADEDPRNKVHHFAKGQHMLAPHERIIYVAGPDFTGTAFIGGKAALMDDDSVPVYLQ